MEITPADRTARHLDDDISILDDSRFGGFDCNKRQQNTVLIRNEQTGEWDKTARTKKGKEKRGEKKKKENPPNLTEFFPFHVRAFILAPSWSP